MSRMGSKKKEFHKPLPAGQILSVEVLQFGAPQGSLQVIPKGGFRRRISFGSSRFADMPIPFSKLPGRVPMFEIQGRRVFVVLDPRTEGFINRGGEFGDVREFLSPRGAIAEIASIDNPLHLEIQPGSRGSLRVYGFEVIFKFEKPLPEKRTPGVKGEERGFFLPPSADIAIERKALWISGGVVALAMVPFTAWLMASPVERIETVADLPQIVLGRVVHPMHLAILPRVLDEASSDEKEDKVSFRAETAVWQAAYWVGELQRRWNAAEMGKEHVSSLEFLKHSPQWDLSEARLESWRTAIDKRMALVESRRTAPDAERYYRFQKESPRVATQVAGGGRGSFRSRLLRRIEGIRQVNRSVRSLIAVEQDFLHTYYKGIIDFKRKLGPNFSVPGEVVFGPKPDKKFYSEADNYVAAQEIAAGLAADPERWHLEDPPETSDATGFYRARKVEGVWLSRQGFLEPAVGSWAAQAAGEEGLVQNALYSIAAKPIPPPPPPVARVDTQAVEAFLVGRREELKACYEAALRRSPRTAGMVRWRWTIDERGEVQNPLVVTTTLEDREFLFCMKARLVSWRFPRPVNGAVSFEYPFQFSARAQ